MFCSKCGCQNDNNVAYCQQCGNPLTAQTQNTYAQANVGYQQTFQPQMPIVNVPIVRSSHPVLNMMKTQGVSPLYIIAIIAFSANLLFSFINAISGSFGMGSGMFDILDSVSGVFGVLQGIFAVFTILGMIPAIIIAVGMWLVFASAINKRDGGMKTAGLTLIKVMSIINMVSCCVFAAIFEIIMIVALFSSSRSTGVSSYYSSVSAAATGAVIVAMIIGGGIFAFLIIYQAKIVKTLNTMKNTIMTGIASDRISSFVAVMCFINGGFEALSIFGTRGIAIIAKLALITALICFGIFLFSYKNKMRLLITPNFPQQQYAVQPSAQYDVSQNTYQQQTNQQYYDQNETGVLSDNDTQYSNRQ